MIKKSAQINKMGVKKQEAKVVKKTEPKKKVVSKLLIWECLCCSKRVISEVKPEQCPCSNPKYVISLMYKVGE